MSIHHLIYELCQGIRLPNPPFCPDDICNLIKRCFLEDPDQRPNFKEIKEILQTAYDALIATAQSNKNKNEKETENPYASMISLKKMKDNTMQERYSCIKRGNETENPYASINPIKKMKDDKMEGRPSIPNI